MELTSVYMESLNMEGSPAPASTFTLKPAAISFFTDSGV